MCFFFCNFHLGVACNYSGDSGGGIVVVFGVTNSMCVCVCFKQFSLVFACIAMSNILTKHMFVAPIFVCKSVGCTYCCWFCACLGLFGRCNYFPKFSFFFAEQNQYFPKLPI